MPVQSISLKKQRTATDNLLILLRIIVVIIITGLFISFINPARVSGLISKNASLFTCALSYQTIGSGFVRALTRGWISQSALTTTYVGALICTLSTVGLAVAACMSLGEIKLRRLCAKVSVCSSVVGIAGAFVLLAAYNAFSNASNPERIDPMFPVGIWFYFAIYILMLLVSLATLIKLPKPTTDEHYHMHPKYRLFLMILPFVVLVVLFSYLPLWGWRYAFFDYRAGFDLTMKDFVGFKWFTYLFGNAATRADIVRVLKNTFAMSGIGIATSWLPMAFAIFLAEIRFNKPRQLVQTFTTIPNFISWVLVYSVAFALFSTEGFINSVLVSLGIIESGSNYLMSSQGIWIKMWLWGTWKGLGWGAIIYIAAISGIDQQLYEAATVDGAGRFQKMWYVTIPCLMPTFFVMLLLSIANILSNGMDQYLVFYNAVNRDSIQVLDLYVYHLGLASSSGNIPLATLIGMLKSLISVTLLFSANKISSMIRGVSIV